MSVVFTSEKRVTEDRNSADWERDHALGRKIINLEQKVKDLEPEYSKAIDDHFWDLI